MPENAMDGTRGVTEPLVCQIHKRAAKLLAKSLAQQGISKEDVEL